jgi:hypothetical protein
VLISRFTLPIIDGHSAKKVLGAVAYLELCSIANELVHSSPVANIVFKRVDKLFVRRHANNVSDERVTANKDLGTSVAAIDSRYIGVNCIGGYSFVATTNVTRREGRLIRMLQGGTHGCPSILCRGMKGVFNVDGRCPCKEWTQCLIIWFMGPLASCVS